MMMKPPESAALPDDRRATASLPGLNVDIRHSRAADGRSETVSVTLTATPDFRSALPLLEHGGLAAVAALWAGPWLTVAETLWGPWLRLAGLPGPRDLPPSLPGPGGTSA